MSNSPSFSNVVSSLVRAQMGSSVPASTLDEELDRRVAELILKEARQKEARYGQTGSYSPQPSGNAAKTNKRFLASIIKSTDEHNKTVLRAQAEAAHEVKQQRERQEREERMKRAQEAVAARTGGSTSSNRNESKRRRDHKSREDNPRRRSASPSRHNKNKGESSRRKDRKDSKRSSHRKRSKKHSASDDEKEEERPRRRERTRSRSPKQRKERRKEDDTNIQGEALDKSKRHPRHKTSEKRPKDRENDPRVDTPLSQEASTSSRTHRRPNEKESLSRENRVDDRMSDILKGDAPAYSSKMDKYFAKDYDPHGFIPPGAFDNWDYMLQVEEKKRLEKLYGSDSSTNEDMISGEMTELLSMQYTKRGATREWDEGKKEI
ncbi:hypothetical protein CPB86DRAFT_806735 [Serendipita vermifera]|nr:hypothetical protein CPB86DRAFT_806735 [Serendipita vermifera]